jgi:UDP-N-acetylmuramyl pentapeptide phosphotransferase/UDP-N-acetylglucosamine-1-phosphate transferase
MIFALSTAVCGTIILLPSRISRLAGRAGDLTSVQSAHRVVTPRVGGIAIFAALIATTYFAPIAIQTDYAQFLLAAGVLFATGLAEDLGWHVPPKGRLFAATVACALVIVLLGAWVPRIGWSLLDPIMVNGLLGIPLTIFVVVGISNAFNLIDGVNGLAGATACVCAIALAWISDTSGYDTMVVFTVLLALSIAGFLLLNYPFGWIFLGDAGAYTLGFVLAWYGVAIVINHPEVTPWAILLTMFWPIADTLLAIYRRRLCKKPAMQPDRLHVHQLVMRCLEIGWLGRNKRNVSNPLTTFVLLPFIAAPAWLGVMLWNRPALAFGAFVGMLVLFFVSYFAVSNMARVGRIGRQRWNPSQPLSSHSAK